MRKSKRGSPFLLAPREVRDIIYRYLFQGLDGQSLIVFNPMEPPWTLGQPRSLDVRSGLSLLKTCRMVHAEAAEGLYACTTFVFTSWSTSSSSAKDSGMALMYRFLHKIGTPNRYSLRSLRLQLGEESGAYLVKFVGDAFDLLAQGHSLRELEIRMIGWSDDVDASFTPFLRPSEESCLLTELKRLGGTVKLKICGKTGEEICFPETLQLFYNELKSQLATAPITTTESLPTETQAQSIEEQVSEHDTKLQEHVDNVESIFNQLEI